MGNKSRLPAALDDHAATTTDIARRPAAHIVTHHARRPPASEGPATALLDAIANLRPAWHAHAACRGRTDLFFPDDHGTYQDRDAARELCAHCPVADPCANYAANWGTSLIGIWNGTSTRRPRAARLDLAG